MSTPTLPTPTLEESSSMEIPTINTGISKGISKEIKIQNIKNKYGNSEIKTAVDYILSIKRQRTKKIMSSISTADKSKYDPHEHDVNKIKVAEFIQNNIPKNYKKKEAICKPPTKSISTTISVSVGTFMNDLMQKPLKEEKEFGPVECVGISQVILMNYDDDTSKICINLNDGDMTIIKNFYDKIGVQIDIELTGINLPQEYVPKGHENMHEDLKKCIFNDINYSDKNEYLNEYIPLVLEKIANEEKIKKYNTKYIKNNTSTSATHSCELFKKKPSDKSSCSCSTLKPEPSDENVYEYSFGNMSPDGTSSDKADKNYPNSLLDNTSIIIPSAILHDYKHKFGPNKTYINAKKLLLKKRDSSMIDEFDISNKSSSSFFNYSAFNPAPVDYSCDFIINPQEFTKNCGENSFIQQSCVTPDTMISVLVNLKYNKSIVIKNPSDEQLNVIDKCQKYGFINLFNIYTDENTIIDFLENHFNLFSFGSIEELNMKIELFSRQVEFTKKHSNSINYFEMEEKLIKAHIKYNYTINSDPADKIKSTDLYNIIIESRVIEKIQNPESFKVRLSKYLQSIGLSKKRYSDGIYYYGIKRLFDNKI